MTTGGSTVKSVPPSTLVGKTLQKITHASTDEDDLPLETHILQHPQKIFPIGEAKPIAQAENDRVARQSVQRVNKVIRIERLNIRAELDVDRLKIVENLSELRTLRRAVCNDEVRAQIVSRKVSADFFYGVRNAQFFHAQPSCKIFKPISKFFSSSSTKRFFAASSDIRITRARTLSYAPPL